MEKNLSDKFFKSTEIKDVFRENQRVVNCTTLKSSHYIQNAINKFLNYENANAWLIAYALYHSKGMGSPK
ncbi:DUF4411 family protein [Rosettibacter primus]|uniref:DUF4411 family protein n=1 Tax=Rosettibacter primus TaxID=3111523 RepID=UPI00336C0CBE